MQSFPSSQQAVPAYCCCFGESYNQAMEVLLYPAAEAALHGPRATSSPAKPEGILVPLLCPALQSPAIGALCHSGGGVSSSGLSVGRMDRAHYTTNGFFMVAKDGT